MVQPVTSSIQCVILFCRELWSFAKLPYAGLSNLETIEKLDSGWRLPQPANCPDVIYKLMLSCWNEDSHARPTMKEILSIIDNLWRKNKSTGIPSCPN